MKKYLLALLVLLISTHNVFADNQTERQKLFQIIKEMAILPATVFGINLLIACGLSYFEVKLHMKNIEDGNGEKKFGSLFWKAFIKYLKILFIGVQLPSFTLYNPYFSHYHYSSPPPAPYRPIIQSYTPLYTPVYMPLPMIITW